MKKSFIFIFVVLSMDAITGPIGCRQGEDFFLVGSTLCNRATCGNPAAMAYCFRTYHPGRTGKRFQDAHPNCVKAFCRRFSDQPMEDKRGAPIATYRDRYHEISLRDDHMPSFSLAEDLYNLLCSEEGHNDNTAQEIFNRIRLEHRHTLKNIKAQRNPMQGGFMQGFRTQGLMGLLNPSPYSTYTPPRIKDTRDVCQIIFGNNNGGQNGQQFDNYPMQQQWDPNQNQYQDPSMQYNQAPYNQNFGNGGQYQDPSMMNGGGFYQDQQFGGGQYDSQYY